MSRVRVPLSGLRAGLRELEVDEARYVRSVLRLREGDTFIVFDPEQVVQAEARVTSTPRGGVRCEVGEVTRAGRVPDVPAWLLLGVCKGDRFEWALREATALGVTDIVPTLCARSASSGTRADASRMGRWRKILVQGARQSGRGDVPTLHEVRGLREAVASVPGSLVRVCLWEGAAVSAGPWLRAGASGVALLVGPEGGIEVDEAGVAEASGFALGSLGPMILRTETAVIAALGAWQMGRERPSS
ncbi:MAG: hypothetical protein CVU63_13510 [Deltaproteobacteria bacterium HGW-Deltaproteobacteria-20]|nr:MAG: hypothetical protein CVU63_13510 [Deltaproteobacteria bacterium HGW-Deltaproteobacteria-20]